MKSIATRIGLRSGDPMRDALRTFGKNCTLIQVGAHVGNTFNDPLWNFFQDHKANPIPGLRAILIEPISDYCAQLRANYTDVPGVTVEQVAIADTSGERGMPRLTVRPEDHGFPAWLDQMSSLKANYLEHWGQHAASDPTLQADYRHFQEFLEKHTVTETVQCLTFDDLFQKHEIDRLDLLQIDVEGYEFEILKTFPFSKLKPRFMNIERIHLGENEWPCWELLKSHGYLLEDVAEDTFCTLI